MKNIILQHWSGNINELTRLSRENISAYAKQVGADYEFVEGDVVDSRLASQSQKLIMLNEKYDDYDTVLMVDADMFIRKGLTVNVFEQPGVGLFTNYTAGVFLQLQRSFPNLSDRRYAYWGGAIYKLDRDLRKKLRVHMNINEMVQFNNSFVDEGIMHRLANLAKVEPSIIDSRWCQCSYLPNPEKAYMIHIRTKITPNGPKRTKMENYNALVEKGII